MNKPDEPGFWDDAEIISTPSRADAIEDGTLIDVSSMAKEAGFKYPVALTARVWTEVVDPTEVDKNRGQSGEGRLWDIFTMLRHYGQKSDSSEIPFRVIVDREGRQEEVELKAIVGPGDTPEPVITILMPAED